MAKNPNLGRSSKSNPPTDRGVGNNPNLGRSSKSNPVHTYGGGNDPNLGRVSDSIPAHNSGARQPNFPASGFNADLGTQLGTSIAAATHDPHSGQYADYRAAMGNSFKATKSPKK